LGPLKLQMISGLDFYVEDLATSVKSIGRIHTVRAKDGSVGRVFCELGLHKAIRTAALAGAGFGLLAFGLGHDEKGLPLIKNEKTADKMCFTAGGQASCAPACVVLLPRHFAPPLAEN